MLVLQYATVGIGLCVIYVGILHVYKMYKKKKKNKCYRKKISVLQDQAKQRSARRRNEAALIRRD